MMRAWMPAALAAAILATAAPGLAQQGAAELARAGEGKRVYQRANCVGCHKWHGGGGGGYGGAALSLRATELTREQIVEVVACGRPSTGMPFHKRGAYDGEGCYGLNRDALGKDVPAEAAAFLRPAEMEAVADYVLAAMKGRGEPGYADCAAYFGEGARVCNSLRAGGPAEAAAAPGGSR